MTKIMMKLKEKKMSLYILLVVDIISNSTNNVYELYKTSSLFLSYMNSFHKQPVLVKGIY